MSEFAGRDQRAGSADSYPLYLIQNRAAHALSKRRQAARLLLRQPAGDPFTVDDLTLADLEATVDDWRFLIPSEPNEREALAGALRERHPFSEEDAPGMAAALNGEGRLLSAAHGQPSEGEGDGDGDRAMHSTIKHPTISSALHGFPQQNLPPETANRALHSPSDQASQLPNRPADPLRDVMRELSWRYFYRGDTLFSEGDAADQLFVLVDGAARATHQNGALDDCARGKAAAQAHPPL